MNKLQLLHKIKELQGLTNDEKAILINLVNTNKKYGLIWEDKPEDVEEELLTKLPVLIEDKEKFVEAKFQQKQRDLFEEEKTEAPKAPNHILIDGDNLHALTALTFTHSRKIDVIYLDPPYNTGNKDFKYNDSFVDKEDDFRHSKWLSFIYKRLKIASSLLANNGIIAISIGFQEVHNLCLLCEGLFQNKQVVCVTVQTSGGKPSGGFNYLQEYVVFITPFEFNPNPLLFSGGINRSPFEGLTLSTFNKTQRPNQTYPIFIDKKTGCIVGTGLSLANRIKNGTYDKKMSDFKFDFNEAPEGTVALWPISSKGNECVWRLIPSRLIKDWESGYIKVSPNISTKNPNKYSVQYLPGGVIDKIKSGELKVVGTETNRPTLVFGENKTVGSDIPTIWTEKDFFTTKGTAFLKEMFRDAKFSYPKPLDLICEILRATSQKNSIIMDFFAGSGTALHATIELNSDDGGNRKCILVTNNENNIAEEVCYERNKRVIEGYKKINGEFVEGFTNNNLRYFKTTFVRREKTTKNKKELTQLATELLCIKEDCYIEIKAPKNIRLFEEDKKRFMVIYDDNAIPKAIDVINSLSFKGVQDEVKVFVFSEGQDPYTEDFIEVADKVSLCALPDAIYKAYLHVLPKKSRKNIPHIDEILPVSENGTGELQFETSN